MVCATGSANASRNYSRSIGFGADSLPVVCLHETSPPSTVRHGTPRGSHTARSGETRARRAAGVFLRAHSLCRCTVLFSYLM